MQLHNIITDLKAKQTNKIQRSLDKRTKLQKLPIYLFSLFHFLSRKLTTKDSGVWTAKINTDLNKQTHCSWSPVQQHTPDVGPQLMQKLYFICSLQAW